MNDTSLNLSSLLNVSASLCSTGKIENAPAGREVLANISARRIALTGVFSEGLSTNGQPAAIAGATLCAYT